MDIKFPISRLTYNQFVSAGARHAGNQNNLAALPNLPLANIADVHRVLSSSAISLKDALALVPKGMHVNIQIVYPTVQEEKDLGLGPTMNINTFGDAVLNVVFDHARALRTLSPDSTRSIVFSSYNPTVCTAINWKQPNYPVFLCNDIGRKGDSASSPAIQTSGRRTISIKEAVRTAKDNNFMGLICSSRLLVR